MKALRSAVKVIGAVATVVSFIPGPWQAPAALIALAANVATVALSIADKQKPSQTGSPTTFDARADGPIPYAMGRTANAGKLVYWKEHGSPSKTPNDRETFVTILSGAGPIQEIERLDVDQATVTFDSSFNAIGFYHGYMWMKAQIGQCPSPHLNYISGEGTPAPGWTPAHLLSGYAAAMWTLVFDSKKGKYYQNGTPPALWVVKGVKVYDPRQDSSFPGGSGPCRAGNEDTYVWAGVDAAHPAGENPFLQALTWIIGRFQNGKRILGIGAPLIGIDVPAYVEGANVCDTNGWKVGGIAYSTDNKWDTLVNILQAGAGEPLALGAKISCMVNAPKVALDTIRVGDLSGGVSVNTTKPRRDRINTITPRVRLEEQFWEAVPLAPVQVAEYLEIDGGPRSKEVPYTFCQDATQAAVLARYDIENAREFEPITLPLRPRWMGYKPGDCVIAILPEVGLNNHKIMLTQRTIDPGSGLPVMTARSETDGKHPYALGQTTVAPPTPSVAVRVPVPAPSTWAITATAVTAGDGTVQPVLVIEGSSDDPNATAIVFEFRRHVDGAGLDEHWLAAGIEPPDVLRKAIPGVASGESFEVCVSYAEGSRRGDRLILGPVTAGSLAVPGSEGPAGPAGPQGTAGIDGNDGAPGAPGINGQTSYVHVAYADSADGATNFTTGGPGTRTYIGILTNFTVADSGAYTDYTWSKLTGDNGLNGANGTSGAPGADGTPSYAHFAYANAADGSVDFHVSDPAGRRYIGVYSDSTLADSTSPASYTWSLVKGADAITGALTAVIWPVLASSDGVTKAGQLPRYSTLTVKQGSSDVTSSCSVSVTPSDSAQIDVSYSGGLVTLSRADSAGYVDVAVTLSGAAVPGSPFRVQISRTLEAAPPASTTSASGGLGAAPTSTSYGGPNGETVIMRANASGELHFSMAATYTAEQPATGTRNYRIAGAAAYRTPGGSYSYSAETTGSLALSRGAPEPDSSPGDLSISALTLTGLTAGAQYEVGGAVRKYSGSSTAPDMSGTFTVSQ